MKAPQEHGDARDELHVPGKLLEFEALVLLDSNRAHTLHVKAEDAETAMAIVDARLAHISHRVSSITIEPRMRVVEDAPIVTRVSGLEAIPLTRAGHVLIEAKATMKPEDLPSPPLRVLAMNPRDVYLPAGAVPGFWLITTSQGAAVAFGTRADDLAALSHEIFPEAGNDDIEFLLMRDERGAPL